MRFPVHLRALVGATVVSALGSGCVQSPGSAIPPFDLTHDVLLVDLDDDGFVDVVAARAFLSGPPPHPGRATVALADPLVAGAFRPPADLPVGSDPLAIAAGDFDDDGRTDLVLACSTARTVDVILQDPFSSEGFAAARVHSIGSNPFAVAVGDLNDDGLDDVALSSDEDGFFALLQDPLGGGSLLPPAPLGPGLGIGDVLALDLDDDGRDDLVGTTVDTNSVVVMLQDPASPGAFLPERQYSVGFQPVALAAGDLDRDGLLDLVAANFGTPGDPTTASASVLLANLTDPGGFLADRRLVTDRRSQGVAVGDLDDDGWLDVAVANSGIFGADGSVSVHTQDAAAPGSFLPALLLPIGLAPIALDIADVDDDDLPDLLVGDGGLWLVRQDPSLPGTFLAPVLLVE